MSTPTSGKGSRLLELLFVVAVIVLVSHFSVGYRPVSRSVEVQFADGSRGGMLIIPASCPSNPHAAGECTCPTAIEGGNDGGGNILYANAADRQINRAGVFQCVTNYTGNHIFVPGNTNAELQSFINAAAGIGVGVSPP